MLKNHKEKLIAERNAERKDDLMRQTFADMKNFDDQSYGVLEDQKKRERAQMEARLQKRKSKKELDLDK